MTKNEFTDSLSSIYSHSELLFLYNYIQRESKTPDWDEIVERLIEKEPIDYILGYTYFYGMKILVNSNTLIPRPETEELVEWILNEYPLEPPKKVLDIGTGSGCIALALSKNWKNKSEITAVDISHQALEIAEKNAQNLMQNIQFQQLDILNDQSWGKLGQFDLIVSNPPYIPIAEKNKMDKQVINYEPHSALFVENNQSLIFYQKILEFGYKHLTKNGQIFFETHQDFYLNYFPHYQLEFKKDFSQNQRMIKAKVESR